ncbi:MAG TPA: diguanylate cyclase [Candidatus Polarisedimenticolaceae bacterium]|nr:diguanylate cyclase [Candidatus Polarisedimenticolaceae bacterium]
MSDPVGARVLLVTDDPLGSRSLAEWIGQTGHQVETVAGTDDIAGEDDDALGLVVTDLDTDDARSRALLESFASGTLFRTTPKLHVFRDLALLRTMRAADPALAATTIPAPPKAEDLQARVRLAIEIGRLERLLARHSVRDSLTGLTNRRYLLLRLEEEIARARRYGTPVSLALFDVDHLKDINDGHGQAAGDAAIRHVGRILRRHVRREDAMGRLGADVFGVVLAGSRYRGAATMANKVRTEAEEADLEHEGTTFAMRLSAGISTFPDNKAITGADDLVRVAEDAVRRAKSRGGNRVFIDEGVLRQERRVVLVADPDAELLELAEDLLTLDDFRVVKAGTGRAALEALRFRLPDLAVVELGMRERDGGVPLVERIQELYPGSRFPIVGLLEGGSADPESLSRLGVDRFITKPFSLSLLRSAARELLESYRV